MYSSNSFLSSSDFLGPTSEPHPGFRRSTRSILPSPMWPKVPWCGTMFSRFAITGIVFRVDSLHNVTSSIVASISWATGKGRVAVKKNMEQGPLKHSWIFLATCSSSAQPSQLRSAFAFPLAVGANAHAEPHVDRLDAKRG